MSFKLNEIVLWLSALRFYQILVIALCNHKHELTFELCYIFYFAWTPFFYEFKRHIYIHIIYVNLCKFQITINFISSMNSLCMSIFEILLKYTTGTLFILLELFSPIFFIKYIFVYFYIQIYVYYVHKSIYFVLSQNLHE